MILNDLYVEKLRDRSEFVFSPDATPSGWLGSKHQLTQSLTNQEALKESDNVICECEKVCRDATVDFYFGFSLLLKSNITWLSALI